MRMDLPKKLMNSVIDNLRGQLYLLFFHHQAKRVRRFVETAWFDPAWQVHLLAFGGVPELATVQEVWATARKALHKPLGGTAGGPDKRDIFSFRGRSGGGRTTGGGPRRGGDDDDGEWSDDKSGIMAEAATEE